MFGFVNLVAWCISGILCAKIAKRKRFSIRKALWCGVLFGIFATFYYSFKKSKLKGWTTKDSWKYVVIHLGLIIGVMIGDFIFLSL